MRPVPPSCEPRARRTLGCAPSLSMPSSFAPVSCLAGASTAGAPSFATIAALPGVMVSPRGARPIQVVDIDDLGSSSCRDARGIAFRPRRVRSRASRPRGLSGPSARPSGLARARACARGLGPELLPVSRDRLRRFPRLDGVAQSAETHGARPACRGNQRGSGRLDRGWRDGAETPPRNPRRAPGDRGRPLACAAFRPETASVRHARPVLGRDRARHAGTWPPGGSRHPRSRRLRRCVAPRCARGRRLSTSPSAR